MERYTKSFTTNTYLLIANLIAVGVFIYLTRTNPAYAIFGAKMLYATTAILAFISFDRFVLTSVNTLDEILGIYNYEDKRYEKPPNLAFSFMLLSIAVLIGFAISSI